MATHLHGRKSYETYICEKCGHGPLFKHRMGRAGKKVLCLVCFYDWMCAQLGEVITMTQPKKQKA